LDEGDPKAKVPHRDRILQFRSPFIGSPQEIARTEFRFSGLTWSEKSGTALLSESDRPTRRTRTWLLSVDSSADPRKIWDRNSQDRYSHPGTPVTWLTPGGQRVLLQNGDTILLMGDGASPEGDRPFLDEFNLGTLQPRRLFQCARKTYEGVLGLLDRDATKFLTRYETPAEPPNVLVRSKDGSERRALTQFVNPTPQLRDIRKELVRYKRADGIDLSFTLYLPPGYKKGERLPTVVWAYPLEYTDPAVAGQVSGSPYRYTSMSGTSHLFFLTQGYAVLDGATMPVLGDSETVNNTYIEQIVASARAAIEKAAEMGVTDPGRVGVGGHSYGAFMTANLLSHCDFFRAGIARSGAYNRTLTPFGFQAERRTLWEAPEVYLKMSPFLYAHKIDEPILLIHGEADNNSGTFPIQSERYYHALKGNGKTVRYVTLPLESHGYAARESIEHTLYEMISWFDRHVKNAPSQEKRPSS
jgi:dipeptidyl aminopeptidase/acylaminoacyl peptidase